MELVALKCPKCGGELEVHEGQKKTFCKYCGSQILLDDGNRIINVIDEARLKEIKLNKEVSDFDQKLRDEEASGRYKNASQKQGRVVSVSDDMPKAFVVCTDKTYITNVSNSTINKRCADKYS